MTDTFILKEFGGNLKPVFQKGKGSEADKELVTKTEFDLVPIQNIKRNINQPRKNFSENEIKKLAKSITKQGIIQPIVVRPIGNNEYELVVGERRLRASKIAKLREIPALIKNYSSEEAFSIALVENLQRENLNPIEEAVALQRLLEEFGLKHDEIAKRVGKSRSAITNSLRLLNLNHALRDLVEKGALSSGHARALLGLKEKQQMEIATLIIKKQLSVRATEELVQKLNRLRQDPTKVKNPFQEQVETWSAQLQGLIHDKVKIRMNPKGEGSIMIHFKSSEEIEWLVNKIKS